MKKMSILITIGVFLASAICLGQGRSARKEIPDYIKKSKAYKRAEWFNTQRAFPYDTIPRIRFAQEMEKEIRKVKTDRLKSDAYPVWSSVGPAGVQSSVPNWGLVSGRVRAMAVHPTDPDYFYIGCDGGVYKSTDNGQTATSQNQGLETMQFYRIASHPSDPQILLGGMQDNETAMTTNGVTWNALTGGDGMECFFNPNPDTIYTSSQCGYLYRSTDGGLSFEVLVNFNGAWIAPFFMHPTNHKILYTANRSIMKSANAGNTWTIIASDVTPSLVATMAQSQVNPDHMIFASGGTPLPVPGNMIVVKVSTNGGSIWNDVTANIPGEIRYIARVVTDPADASTMYIVRTGFSPGNKVYKTTDLGQTWTNISGDLPDLPCSDLFIDPENTNNLYLANDIGVYLSIDGGVTWKNESEGLPFVPVIDFDYVKINSIRYLRIGTFGRSMYETQLGFGIGISEPKIVCMSASFELIRNFPNPANTLTTIEFELQKPGRVELKIYNHLGQQVSIPFDGFLQAGKQNVKFDAYFLPAGFYIYCIQSGAQTGSGKIVKL